LIQPSWGGLDLAGRGLSYSIVGGAAASFEDVEKAIRWMYAGMDPLSIGEESMRELSRKKSKGS
ncbi:hypothetical protein Pmar_PMAR011551, partial [Perkinsus marinus ATCC 50983]